MYIGRLGRPHRKKMKEFHTTQYLSISSAGTDGNLLFGMIDALERHLPEYETWRGNLCGVSGSSAGCIAALAIVLGLSKETRAELYDCFDVRRVVKSADVTRLVKEYGMDNGGALRDIVQNVLQRGGLSPYSTLGDIKRLLRVNFVCVGTDLMRACPIHMSSLATPDLRVDEAVFASCAVPFVFSPSRIPLRTLGRSSEDDDAMITVVDGGLVCHLPNVFEASETMFVHIERPEGDVPLNGWQDFMGQIFRCCTEQQQKACDALVCEHGTRALALRNPHPTSTTGFDLHIDASQRRLLARRGYVTTVDALKGGALMCALHDAIRLYIHTRANLIPSDPEEMPPGP